LTTVATIGILFFKQTDHYETLCPFFYLVGWS
jgi:hypothetical protein